MSNKRVLAKSIEANLEYEVKGVDLVKYGVTLVLMTTEREIIGIGHLGYDKLISSAKELSPTTFAM